MKVLTWDWKAQIDLKSLASAVQEVSEGRVHLTEFDTGGDLFGLVVSEGPVTQEQALQAWEETWDT